MAWFVDCFHDARIELSDIFLHVFSTLCLLSAYFLMLHGVLSSGGMLLLIFGLSSIITVRCVGLLTCYNLVLCLSYIHYAMVFSQVDCTSLR